MSSREDEDKAEVTLCGVNVGPRGEEPVRFLRTGLRVPPRPGLGIGQMVPPRGNTKGEFQGPQASDYGFQLMAVGEVVLCDPEGLVGVTALRGDDIRDEERPDLMALMPEFTEESEAAREPPPVLHQEPGDVRRNPSPVSCWDENSARWQGLNSVVCARPPFPPDLVEVHPAAASSRSLSGPKGGQDGRLTRRGSRDRLNVPKTLLQRAPSAEGLTKLASELDTPDDFNEIQETWSSVSGQRTHHAGVSSGLSLRAQEAPRNPHVMVLSQGDIMVKESACSGYQEQHEYPLIPEFMHLPPGRVDCPRCIVLQTEVVSLKKRLAIMESLVEKLRELCK